MTLTKRRNFTNGVPVKISARRFSVWPESTSGGETQRACPARPRFFIKASSKKIQLVGASMERFFLRAGEFLRTKGLALTTCRLPHQRVSPTRSQSLQN